MGSTLGVGGALVGAFFLGRNQDRVPGEVLKNECRENQEWQDLLANGERDWVPWLSVKDESSCSDVFQFETQGGQNILKISGEMPGGITTREKYENFHLIFSYRWGNKIWPRHNAPGCRDSGVLIHCFGEQGLAYGHWSKSIEFQLKEGHPGALWVLYTLAEAPVLKTRLQSGSIEYQFSRNCFPELITECAYSPLVRERKIGDWNRGEIYCVGEKAVFSLNGEVSMLVTSMRKAPEDGGGFLKRGAIQLQSDGAEIEFKDIKIRRLESFPIKFSEMFKDVQKKAHQVPRRAMFEKLKPGSQSALLL